MAGCHADIGHDLLITTMRKDSPMAKRPAKPSSKKAPAPAPAAPAVLQTQQAQPPKTPRKSVVTKEMIAKRAYEIWVAKGRPVGQDLENWQQAERELLS